MVEVFSRELILIGKAVFIIFAGLLVGLISKHVVRKIINRTILKTVFKEDASSYETARTINRIFAEVLQWLIFIGFFNYALIILNFNFLNKALSYVVSDIPRIIGFVLILAAGPLISKIIAARFKNKDFENKKEVTSLIEIIVISAFGLTALEFIGVKATALVELYKVILYIIGIVILFFILKIDMFQKRTKKKTRQR